MKKTKDPYRKSYHYNVLNIVQLDMSFAKRAIPFFLSLSLLLVFCFTLISTDNSASAETDYDYAFVLLDNDLCDSGKEGYCMLDGFDCSGTGGGSTGCLMDEVVVDEPRESN